MLGPMLKNLRMKSGLTQAELAHALNLHQKTIKNWEADISDPNAENICAIADLFHVTIDSLFGRDSQSISLSMLNDSDRRKAVAVLQAFIDASIC